MYNSSKVDNALVFLIFFMLALSGLMWWLGYTAGQDAKIAKSNDATLIEGFCVDVLNSDRVVKVDKEIAE